MMVYIPIIWIVGFLGIDINPISWLTDFVGSLFDKMSAFASYMFSFEAMHDAAAWAWLQLHTFIQTQMPAGFASAFDSFVAALSSPAVVRVGNLAYWAVDQFAHASVLFPLVTVVLVVYAVLLPARVIRFVITFFWGGSN